MLIEKNISENSIVAIKVSTGEEMIAKLISQNEDSIKVKTPMAFVRMQQSMGLMPWMATPEPDAELSIDKKFIQYQIFDKFSEKKVIYSLSNLMMRENSETLELYKKLLVQKIILPGIDGDGKNSLKLD